MSADQLAILLVLVGTMGLFLWGRLRHDIVAMLSLMACVVLGLVSAENAFSGFGHPAVITVACVLILGYGLQHSGAVDILADRVLPQSAGPVLSTLAIMSLAAVLSGFMNNVGALALLMPVSLQIATRLNIPPGRILMPLAFGSILGGMTTLIGTPPNLIVSGFRQTAGLGGFSIFDFTQVGLAIALTGVAFIGLIGWRLVPNRETDSVQSFESGAYRSEVRVLPESPAVGEPLYKIERLLDEVDAQVVGMVRGEFRVMVPNPRRVLKAGDILLLEVDPQLLSKVLKNTGLVLEEAVSLSETEDEEAPAEGEPATVNEPSKNDDEVVLKELVVMPNSPLLHRTASDIELRSRYGINLLAISQRGRQSIKRLRTTPIFAGDVLLMQGLPEAIAGFAADSECLPLATRDLKLPNQTRVWQSVAIMAFAVAVAASGVVPASLAFAGGVLLMLIVGVVPLRSAYSGVDWPVIVLLAAMLPVADAMATTGAAQTVASFLIDTVAQGHAVAGLVVILVITMFLSDVMNNAATAAVMCPIAMSVANYLGVNVDTYLMAVAIGASCAFLTPIGHQNNTLILGPGGFRFGDYWRLGLAVEAIVLLVGVPMLLWVWPL
ncbi:MAG: SLC13 family permease [Moraxellaceae bacterium]|nr:SLC13 family permease [Moraxellaceae bacterium]MDZ4297241.1 SLC13 family permease [Moraxellaceae bacterium]MDZ4386221.1 SLC13 family permease [Moraxellaceae bacterium]